MTSSMTYPARMASTAQLEGFSNKARDLQLGQAGNRQLWAESNRALAHIGYAVCVDRMHGRKDVGPGDATIFTLAGGRDVLLVTWWVRLRPNSAAPFDTFPLIICMEPQDYTALDQITISADLLPSAHELAAEFLTAAGSDQWRPSPS